VIDHELLVSMKGSGRRRQFNTAVPHVVPQKKPSSTPLELLWVSTAAPD